MCNRVKNAEKVLSFHGLRHTCFECLRHDIIVEFEESVLYILRAVKIRPHINLI